MTACTHCGKETNAEAGVVVGTPPSRDETICTVCRARDLETTTVLSAREAEIAAHKQLSEASHATIADRLDLSKSTVDEYSRRIKKKITEARVTGDEVGDLME